MFDRSFRYVQDDLFNSLRPGKNNDFPMLINSSTEEQSTKGSTKYA